MVTKHTWPGLFSQAYKAAVTPTNIQSGFKACGIYPLNPDILPSDVFSPSQTLDRPQPPPSVTSPNTTGPTTVTVTAEVHSTSSQMQVETPSTSVQVSPSVTVNKISCQSLTNVPGAITGESTSADHDLINHTQTEITINDFNFTELADGSSILEFKGLDSQLEELFACPIQLPQVSPNVSGKTKRKTSGSRLLTGPEFLEEKKEIVDAKAAQQKLKEERKKAREEKKLLKEKQNQEKILKSKMKKCKTESKVTKCPVCGNEYGKDDDIWVQCDQCKMWMHIRCVPNNINTSSIQDENTPFICHMH